MLFIKKSVINKFISSCGTQPCKGSCSMELGITAVAGLHLHPAAPRVSPIAVPSSANQSTLSPLPVVKKETMEAAAAFPGPLDALYWGALEAVELHRERTHITT